MRFSTQTKRLLIYLSIFKWVYLTHVIMGKEVCIVHLSTCDVSVFIPLPGFHYGRFACLYHPQGSNVALHGRDCVALAGLLSKCDCHASPRAIHAQRGFPSQC